MKREFYIDNLRILLTVLVIIHHTAIAYGASGGWCYVTPNTIQGAGMIGLSSMLAVDQAFFMSLFFFISALFTPVSLEKKGTAKFVKDRLMRLGIPLLLTMFLINPSLLYGISIYTQSTSANWSAYVWGFIKNIPTTSHMWFVLALLIFESIYLLYRKFHKDSISSKITDRMPTNLTILIFVVVCSLFAFSIRLFYPIGGKNFIGLQFGYFGLYTIFYALGILASRKNWLEKLSFQQARIWGFAALAVIPLIVLAWISLINDPSLFEQFIGGFHWRAFALAAWEALVCTGISYFLLMAFKKYLNRSTEFFTNMAANSYTVYFIHPVIVVGFTMLFEQISFAPFITFVIVAVLSLIACYTVSHLIRKIPGVKRIL
jgi:surface polysaccharide O-acyltransferase-like enzyme